MATIGALATFKDRIDVIDDTVKSLLNQVDLLMIYCNDEESYRHARRITTNGTVKTFWGPNITDRGKFHWCKMLQGSGIIYFAFDDDLIYPPHYVDHTLQRLKSYNNQAIVSYHGKQLTRRGIESYYSRLDSVQSRTDYRVLDAVIGDHLVDVIGCGCIAFDLEYFCPDPLNLDMMTDVEVSCLAEMQHKQKVVLSHTGGWVRYNPKMSGKWTIWDHFQHSSDKIQTDMINSIFM